MFYKIPEDIDLRAIAEKIERFQTLRHRDYVVTLEDHEEAEFLRLQQELAEMDGAELLGVITDKGSFLRLGRC